MTAASSTINGVLQSNPSASQGLILNQMLSQLPQVHTININGQQALFIPTPNATQLTQFIGLQQAVAAAAASVNSATNSLNIPRTVTLPSQLIPTAGTTTTTPSASIQIPLNTRTFSSQTSTNPFIQLNTTSGNIENRTVQLNAHSQTPTLQLHCQPSTNGSLSFSFTNNAPVQQQQQQQLSPNVNVIVLNGTNAITQPVTAATNLFNSEIQDFQQMTTAAQLQFPVNQLATQLLQALLGGGGNTQINSPQQQQTTTNTLLSSAPSMIPQQQTICENTNYDTKNKCEEDESVINTKSINKLLLGAAKKWLTLGANNINNNQRDLTTFNETTDRVLKRSRKSCECPNCIFFKSNVHNTIPITTSLRRTHRCHYPDCGKEYLKTSHLRAHLRSHIGERPYVCNWNLCGKSFTRSDELLRHKRTHAGEKNFECIQCHKRFLRSDHLRKHSKIHGGDLSNLSTNIKNQKQQNQNIIYSNNILSSPPIKVENFDLLLDFPEDKTTTTLTDQTSFEYCPNNIMSGNILCSNFNQSDYYQ
ncbi:unnamed protein product [Didymodactylos carnosus]|uniref:C2H2-type domain-containing protein n=1 Tax=Didymodactylos carnosus TaxID=1234261 RepID=A0A814HUD9_9BILA|nr:unnamed protein product [Didymodactylos carnosus]CAF1014263.1 unnamed protein product [Didymodactylos carnosus]CAF3612950.1 unnamed protein product [Didymodactylos carnosus]CAF3785785.1 unnamed protein product [Didymodactylos carnosus]